MKKGIITYIKVACILLTICFVGSIDVYAQQAKSKRQEIAQDSLTHSRTAEANALRIDSLNKKELQRLQSPIDTTQLAFQADSIQLNSPIPKERFIPNANKAIWLALVFPGGGQIYNRKYWNLPIVYGGFVGCTYALNWNNKMYKDYSQAYLDIMDDDPNTNSYEDFLPLNSNIAGQETRYKELFKKRKDLFRRQRDLSIFCFIGVYLLSVIDAYVDAELSDFDISKDLGLKIEPAIINDNKTRNYNSLGLQCSLKF